MFSVIIRRLKINSFEQFLPYRKHSIKPMHSTPVSHDYEAMQVKVLPALSDNYMYLLIDKESREAAIVDPVDPELVLSQAKEANVNITTVLTTHHHYDHAGGNSELVKKLENPSLRVVGGDDKRIPALTMKVRHNQEFLVGSLTVKCLQTPCHTTSHICYFITSPQVSHPVVFTGDTLFVAGCGRFFEGTAEQMDTALNERLGTLPDDTKVYCGHEYTRKNLEFAKKVEPHNEHVKEKLQAVVAERNAKAPTVPSTIGEEKKTNPFMRVHCIEVQRFANKMTRKDVMQFVRNAKDNF